MTLHNARAIMARLQKLQGDAAIGELLVHATGADVPLPAGSFAVPTIDGALTWDAQVFVSKNPLTSDGSWTITSAGTLVTVEALQGGAIGNRPDGTVYRWHLPVTGVEATSAASGPLEGGEHLGTLGALKQVRYYRELNVATKASTVEALFRAMLADYPGAVLAWESSKPQDGSFTSTPGSRRARAAGDRMLFRHNWVLWLVSSRLDGAQLRQHESDLLRQDVLGRLFNAKVSRGLRLSASPGVELSEARVAASTPTGYVDLVRFSTLYVECAETDDANYDDWLATRLRVQTEDQPPDPALDLPDLSIDHS